MRDGVLFSVDNLSRMRPERAHAQMQHLTRDRRGRFRHDVTFREIINHVQIFNFIRYRLHCENKMESNGMLMDICN